MKSKILLIIVIVAAAAAIYGLSQYMDQATSGVHVCGEGNACGGEHDGHSDDAGSRGMEIQPSEPENAGISPPEKAE